MTTPDLNTLAAKIDELRAEKTEAWEAVDRAREALAEAETHAQEVNDLLASARRTLTTAAEEVADA